jgi:hypothetical protein
LWRFDRFPIDEDFSGSNFDCFAWERNQTLKMDGASILRVTERDNVPALRSGEIPRDDPVRGFKFLTRIDGRLLAKAPRTNACLRRRNVAFWFAAVR